MPNFSTIENHVHNCLDHWNKSILEIDCFKNQIIELIRKQNFAVFL